MPDPTTKPEPQPQPEPLAKAEPQPELQPKPHPEPHPEPQPEPLAQRLKDWLDALLVGDVFLVIGAALWFGLAVVLHSRKIEAPLRLFERLWQPLFLPAISLLMAAAIVSGVLGWWRRRGQS